MDPDAKTYREEQREADVDAERMKTDGKVECPWCHNEVEEDTIKTCQCSRKFCLSCGSVQRIAGFADEPYCGRLECEKKGLEQAIKGIMEMFERDVEELRDCCDEQIKPINKRLAAIYLESHTNIHT